MHEITLYKQPIKYIQNITYTDDNAIAAKFMLRNFKSFYIIEF